MALPHLQNSQAGVNRWDPVHNCIFEVYFTLPEPLKAEFGQDEALITEHVLKISGLDALDRGPEASVTQKFMGTTRTFVAPKLDDTSAEITVDLSLNLRNATDNYIYKIFKSWKNLNYNLETGEITLKSNYCADWLKVSIGNRQGDIIREVIFKDVMLSGGLDGATGDFEYTTPDPVQMSVKFKSDWWKETIA